MTPHPQARKGTTIIPYTPDPSTPDTEETTAAQAWFWTPSWQAGERQATIEITAGGLAVYDDMAALLADLDP